MKNTTLLLWTIGTLIVGTLIVITVSITVYGVHQITELIQMGEVNSAASIALIGCGIAMIGALITKIVLFKKKNKTSRN